MNRRKKMQTIAASNGVKKLGPKEAGRFRSAMLD
jgi:hypothetical protein